MDEDSFNEKLSQLTDEQEAAAEYESTAATNAPAEGVKRPSSSPSGGGDDREQMLPATKRSRDTSEETEGINAMTDTGAAAGVELLPPPAEPTGDTAGIDDLNQCDSSQGVAGSRSHCQHRPHRRRSAPAYRGSHATAAAHTPGTGCGAARPQDAMEI